MQLTIISRIAYLSPSYYLHLSYRIRTPNCRVTSLIPRILASNAFYICLIFYIRAMTNIRDKVSEKKTSFQTRLLKLFSSQTFSNQMIARINLFLLTLLSALSSMASAVLEIQVTETTYITDDCSGSPTGGDTHFPYTAPCSFFNGVYPESLFVAWSDISGLPAMSVQFLIDNSTCSLPQGSAVVPSQDLYITVEGCCNVTGLYGKTRVTGISFLPLDPADAAAPLDIPPYSINSY